MREVGLHCFPPIVTTLDSFLSNRNQESFFFGSGTDRHVSTIKARPKHRRRLCSHQPCQYCRKCAILNSTTNVASVTPALFYGAVMG
jgi:hypothetical protein